MFRLPLAILASMILVPAISLAQVVVVMDMANDKNDTTDELDSEPSIAVNPLNPNIIAVTTFSGEWRVKKPAKKDAPVWMTINGGVSWEHSNNSILPSPNWRSTGPADQKIVYDGRGRLYLVEMADDLDPPRCYIYRPIGTSNDHLPGAVFCDDQPQIAVFGSRLFIPWLDRFDFDNPRSVLTIADDEGVDKKTIDKNTRSIGVAKVGNVKKDNRTTRIAVAPNGNIYVIFKVHELHVPDPNGSGFERAKFMVRTITDNGRHLNPAVSIYDGKIKTWYTANWGKNKTYGRAKSSDAWIATDPVSSDVWAVFCNVENNVGQIWATHSKDGQRWDKPMRVTDGTRNSAFPEVAVAANGTIGVLYIDYRHTSGTETVFSHRFARLFPQTTTWSDTTLQEMTTADLEKMDQDKLDKTHGFLWGDYEGLTTAGDTFYGVFCGLGTNRQHPQLDPFFFKIPATP